ncbi:MAG: hypothetical protein ABIJ65_02570 [Chloroflexota bacterium]
MYKPVSQQISCRSPLTLEGDKPPISIAWDPSRRFVQKKIISGQIPSGRFALEMSLGQPPRICWETNNSPVMAALVPMQVSGFYLTPLSTQIPVQ